MNSERINPHVGVVAKVIHLKLFLDMVTAFFVDNVTTSVLVCFRGEAPWTIHVSKICITGLVFFTRSYDL